MGTANPTATIDLTSRGEVPVGAFESILKLDSPILLKLLEQSPQLKIFTPSHPLFSGLNKYFQLDPNLVPEPLAICRPSNEQEISEIIRFAVTSNLPISVRTGGHDCWVRSSVMGGIVIDMREINQITLAHDHESVRIGGGTISGSLTTFLAPHGLVCVQGGCSSVGYTNWAACGGYGSSNGSFGLGCDQIIGARLVNPSGEIVDADEELLWGLRGGGCNFGVITALDIKVYKLPKMLAGIIAFPIAQARDVLLGYKELLRCDFPDAYGGLMGFLVLPGTGTSLMMLFTWSSSDLDTGKKYLEKIRGLGSAVMDTVVETTQAQWTEVGKAFSPTAIYTNIRTAYVERLSEPFIDLLLKHTGQIPQGSKAMFIIHNIHGEGAKPNSESCFGTRKPHIWLGIHGQTMEENTKNKAYAWADEVVLDLMRNGMIMKGGYVALMKKDEVVNECFGDNWEKLKALKAELDSQYVFQHAVPNLV